MYVEIETIEGALPRTDATLRITLRGIVFNHAASEQLKLDSSSQIKLMWIRNKKSDMYVCVAEKGMRLHKCNNRYVLYNRSLARRILYTMQIERTALFRLGESEYINDEKMTPIITRQNYYE